MPFRVGPMEMIILLVIVMMIFGIGRLPQIGNVLGKSIKEFRNVQEDVNDISKFDAEAGPKESETGKT